MCSHWLPSGGVVAMQLGRPMHVNDCAAHVLGQSGPYQVKHLLTA